jgi:hypothetical protein
MAAFFLGVEAWLLVPWVFYSLVCVLGVLAICSLSKIENQNTFSVWSFLLSVVIVVLAIHHYEVSWNYVTAHPWLWIIAGLAYVIVGVIVASYKWYMYASSVKEKFIEFVNQWLWVHPTATMEELRAWQELDADWKSNFIGKFTSLGFRYEGSFYKEDQDVTYSVIVKAVVPRVHQNKSLITEWIALWPLVAIVIITQELVGDIFRLAFKFVRNVFQSLADRMFADL